MFLPSLSSLILVGKRWNGEQRYIEASDLLPSPDAEKMEASKNHFFWGADKRTARDWRADVGQLKFYVLLILEEAVAASLPVDNIQLENNSCVTWREMHHFAISQQANRPAFFSLMIVCITPLYSSSSPLTSKRSHNLLTVGLCKHDVKPPG